MTRKNLRVAFRPLACSTLLAASLCVGPGASAQTIWDGSGNPNSSGDTSVPTNWSTDTVPSAAQVVLPNVTTGIRTVTLDGALSWTQLDMQQTTSGAQNILALGQNLILSNADPFIQNTNSGAGVSAVQINLGGRDLTLSTSLTGSAETIANTLNFDAANSRFRHANGSNVSVTFNFIGAINATASGSIERNFTGGTSSGGFTNNLAAGSSLSVIGNSALAFRYTGGRSTALTVGLNNAGSISVTSGSALQIENDHTTAAQAGNTSFQNQAGGTFTQGGTLALQARNSGNTNSINNSGTWIVNGPNAKIVEMATVAAGGTASTSFASTGLITGATTNDVLDYDDNEAGQLLLISQSNIVDAGNGFNATDESSVGRLTLSDINLTLGSTATLRLDIAGLAAGQFDRLSLSTGILDISATPTLSIAYTDGFAPVSSYSLQILDYSAINVAFDLGVKFNILNATGDAADKANYSITYNPAGFATLNYTAIPEPNGLHLGILGMALLMASNRLGRRTRAL